MRTAQTANASNPLRTFCYLEDDQGFSKTPVTFQTDCPATVEELEKMSWGPKESGRLSTSFPSFKRILEGKGFVCNQCVRFPEGAEPPFGYTVVKGATGNY